MSVSKGIICLRPRLILVFAICIDVTCAATLLIFCSTNFVGRIQVIHSSRHSYCYFVIHIPYSSVPHPQVLFGTIRLCCATAVLMLIVHNSYCLYRVLILPRYLWLRGPATRWTSLNRPTQQSMMNIHVHVHALFKGGS